MAQPIALFVSEMKLKSFSSVNANVSPTELVPYILQAQDIYISNYIGATYYYSLKDQVLRGQVTPDNQLLLDEFLQQAVLNYALMQALPFLKYKIYNKSILSPTSENSDSITLDELKFLQSELKDAAEFYMKRAIEWMVLHPGRYPLYITPNVNDGILPERGSPYSQGLTVPRRPYAYQKRYGFGNRDSGYLGTYDGCFDCWMVPNSVSPRNV